MHKLRLFSFFLTFAISIPAWVLAGNLSRGPYLQQATPDSVVVVWRTDGESTPVLRYGKRQGSLTKESKGDSIVLRISADVNASADIPRLFQEAGGAAGSGSSTAANSYQYEAHVSGLQSDTKYYYAIYDGDRLLAGNDADHYFVSHDRIGSATDMRLWVVGDSGTGGEDQAMVHDAMLSYVNRTSRKVDHYIHVGDMAYGQGTDQQFQDNFFAPYQVTLRNTVCWPAMGNHEGHTSRGISGIGPYYDAYVVPTKAEAGGVPSGTEAYYSFDIEEVHFICMDSHDLDRSPDSAMAQWLRADLEQATGKWLVAFWHHPPYTMGSHNSDRETQLVEMRENFMPILEAGGVDITLTGHSHIYERSMLMDGAYDTPTTAEGVILDDGDGRINGDGAYRKSKGIHPHEGSVSIVAGNGGASLSREGTMPVMREIILEHGSVIMDIQGDTLTGTMLNKEGQLRDIFSIVKRGKVTPVRIKDPWQPINDSSLLTENRLDFNKVAPGSIPEGWRTASGNITSLAVTAESNDRHYLRAQAKKTPLVALCTEFESSAFELVTKVRLQGKNGKGAGIVFGYRDSENFGRIFLDPAAGTVRVSRFADGSESILAEKKARIQSGRWLSAEITIADGEIEVQLQDDADQAGEIAFAVKLDTPFPKSPAGFYIPRDSSAEFQFFAFKARNRP